MNQNNTAQSGQIALFALAFRPFFLSAAGFSVVAIALWAFYWAGGTLSQPLYSWNWWHGHEMLYGFVVPVIVGFLLTAVQNWTGIKTITGIPLILLYLIWLAGRILILFPGNIDIWAIALIDVMFLPLAAFFLAIPIVVSKNWKNLFFVFIFLVMSVLNGFMHWFASEGNLVLAGQLMLGMIFWVAVVMVIMGGRVIPFFTANGAGIKKPQPISWLEKLSIISVVLIAISFSLTLQNSIPGWTIALLCGIAFVANIWRLGRWQSRKTIRIPLLWSLHLAYAFVSFSFLLLALYFLNILNDLNSLIHMTTIGGMGLLILAMMSRVSLGHTGRPLIVGRFISIAFLSIAISAVIRVFFVLQDDSIVTGIYVVSAVFWLVGFSIFVWKYFNVLVRSRVDGRPG